MELWFQMALAIFIFMMMVVASFIGHLLAEAVIVRKEETRNVGDYQSPSHRAP